MFLKPLRMHVVTLTANVRFKMENEQIKTLKKTIVMVKTGVKILFFGRSN